MAQRMNSDPNMRALVGTQQANMIEVYERHDHILAVAAALHTVIIAHSFSNPKLMHEYCRRAILEIKSNPNFPLIDHEQATNTNQPNNRG